jgi:multidrug resistance efflux pump
MKTQAWGWLAAAALAAGLNASYHDGGLQWAHNVADHVKHNTNAVLALATGHADQFMAEAQFVTAHKQNSSCPLTAALAEVRTMVAPSESDADSDGEPFEAISAREQAQVARLEANRARIEAQVARIRIPAMAFSPVVVQAPKVSVCPRVRVNMPHMPAVNMPAMPVVQIMMSEGGTV